MATKKAEKDIIIKKWNAVALWKFSAPMDTCTICRNSLQGPCIDCQSGVARNGPIDCAVVRGNCNHMFHAHCLSRWLQHGHNCPLCNSVWDYAS
ncbi:MAG: putative RING-box protein 1A [Streblomastix strix]|uniref:Putative RING-box protein 1A n=1 Tax=Streblomastix strix TaxID=222440 RepID=A0A5J4V8B1_9EUKA|nr:MAG: putative RING-box protein 1A [Streblomastix strix]